jgi:hypothetical protein
VSKAFETILKPSRLHQAGRSKVAGFSEAGMLTQCKRHCVMCSKSDVCGEGLVRLSRSCARRLLMRGLRCDDADNWTVRAAPRPTRAFLTSDAYVVTASARLMTHQVCCMIGLLRFEQAHSARSAQAGLRHCHTYLRVHVLAVPPHHPRSAFRAGTHQTWQTPSLRVVTGPRS